MVFSLIYTVFKENEFYKSEFRKKVERISIFRNVDCFYFNDGTNKCFSAYSVIDKRDTLKGVRLIRFISVGDSVVKCKNEALIRVVKE